MFASKVVVFSPLRTHRGHRRQNAMAMEDPEVKLLVDEIRKLRIDENAA